MPVEVVSGVAKEFAKEVAKEVAVEAKEIARKEVERSLSKIIKDGPLSDTLNPEDLRDYLKKKEKEYVSKDEKRMSIEKDEKKYTGGRYGDIPTEEGIERHHIPADSVSPLERGDGPCIQMDRADHKRTASFDNIKGGDVHRGLQEQLIKDGKFREAFEMDVKDIQSKFGDKYNEAIEEAREYLNKLESEGRI